MPNLQTTVPDETAEAIQAEADRRVPKDSVSRVIAEVLIPAFAKRPPNQEGARNAVGGKPKAKKAATSIQSK